MGDGVCAFTKIPCSNGVEPAASSNACTLAGGVSTLPAVIDILRWRSNRLCKRLDTQRRVFEIYIRVKIMAGLTLKNIKKFFAYAEESKK